MTTQVEVDTLYGVNKQLYAKVTPSKKQIDKQLEELKTFISYSSNTYWMLLCREKNDYTVFNIVESAKYEKMINELKEVLEGRGTIIDVRYSTTSGFYECWIKEKGTAEVFMYALFPCDSWVINIE